MTAQEKSLLYNLFNKADCLFSGRIPSDFQELDFKDDISKKSQNELPEQESVGSNSEAALYDTEKTAENLNSEQTSEPVFTTAIQHQNNSDAAARIKQIALSVAQCTGCILCKTRTNTVPGIGNVKPVVLVVGEGPGADEDRTGEPFVGKAGQLLDKMLAAIQLSRNDNCFIANIVKCRPPANRTPLPEEAQACAHFLQAQIDVLKPKMILAVGNTALHNLMNTTTGIKKLHGQFFSYQGIPLLATFHPSALLRDESLKRPAWEDLKIFRNKLLEIAPDYQASYLNGGSN